MYSQIQFSGNGCVKQITLFGAAATLHQILSVTSSVSGGEGAARAADIIDLDRYMRAAVRPSAHREHLVVDAGVAGRRPRSRSGSDSRDTGSDEPPLARLRISTPPRSAYPHKRFSHDSGVSDGSYARRKQRPIRRNDSSKARESSRHSSSSIRELKAVCERTLREQQAQISRVAELCERLAQPERARPARPPRNADRSRQERAGSATSEDSSSSRSSRDRKKRDKHSSDSCKTYKIIMTKLDELGRVLAVRKQAPAARAAALSSASVSVCDKLVATEPHASLAPTVQTVYTHVEGRLGVTRAARLDIAPRRDMVAVHSVAKSECTSECSARGPGGFDLDDPVHLYAQAKRLSPVPQRVPFEFYSERREARGAGCDKGEAGTGGTGGRSLCALCRRYWQALVVRLPAYLTKDW